MKYLAVEYAEHGCCHHASVVDTTKPEQYDPGKFEMVCEAFSMENAKWIADCLNKCE